MIAYSHLSAEKLQALFAGARQRILDPSIQLENIRLEIGLVPTPGHIPYLLLGDPVCFDKSIGGGVNSREAVPAMLHHLIGLLFRNNEYYVPPCGTGVVAVMVERNLSYSAFVATLIGTIYPCWPKPQSVYWGTLLKFARKGIYENAQTSAQ